MQTEDEERARRGWWTRERGMSDDLKGDGSGRCSSCRRSGKTGARLSGAREMTADSACSLVHRAAEPASRTAVGSRLDRPRGAVPATRLGLHVPPSSAVDPRPSQETYDASHWMNGESMRLPTNPDQSGLLIGNTKAVAN